jgi:hypothetical protein
MKRRDLPLIAVKLFASGYNIAIAYVAAISDQQVDSSALLSLNGLLILFGTISRLGSDNYWLKSSDGTIRTGRYDIYFILLSSALSAATICWISHLSAMRVVDVASIFFLLISQHLYVLASRVGQVRGYHTMALSIQLLGSTWLAIPILVVTGISPLGCLLLSSSVTLPLVIAFIKSNFISESSDEPFIVRLHYMPLLILGSLNQSFFPIVGYASRATSLIADAMLLQKLAGLCTWPAAIYMQHHLPYISRTSRAPLQNGHFGEFVRATARSTLLLAATIVLTLSITSLLGLTPNPYVAAGSTVVAASSISALLSLLPMLTSIANKGQIVIFALLVSLIVSLISTLVIGHSLAGLSAVFLIYQCAFFSSLYCGIKNTSTR